MSYYVTSLFPELVTKWNDGLKDGRRMEPKVS